MTMRLLVLALLGLAVSSCAGPRSTGSSSSGAAAASPRVRCLANPHETGTRPLIFLMCIESP